MLTGRTTSLCARMARKENDRKMRAHHHAPTRRSSARRTGEVLRALQAVAASALTKRAKEGPGSSSCSMVETMGI